MAVVPLTDGMPRFTLEPTAKWIRAVLDGQVVADSRDAKLVRRESGPPPTYAFPKDDVDGALPDRAAFDVDDHVAIRWDAVDHWYEEDEEVFIHPRDPTKRIDVLPSRRHVVVERDGERLAESRRPTLLFEGDLPVRYYLPHPDVELERLRPSDNVTGCPYKGWASYYDARVGGEWVEDLVWTYKSPFREVDPVRGLLCFYNEKVNLVVDGQPQDRPSSPFS